MTAGTSLTDVTVLVTGASRGLGRAMALGLLAAGARVGIAAAAASRQLDETLALAAELAPRERFVPLLGDLRRMDDCERVVSGTVAALGHIDVLVNNAGIPNQGENEPFWTLAPQDWMRIAHTNTDSVFFMCHAVGAGMVARGRGKIINVSTSDRTMVRPRFTPYGPSKAFVEACTRAWAQELEGTGVSMNVLSPGGSVDTAADVTGVPAAGRSFLPANVMVPPLRWLASAQSDGINGQRFIANLWNEDLPLEVRIVAARQSGADLPRIM